MVAAEILVALVKSPWNRKAGDNAAEKILGLVRPQHGSGRTIEVDLAERFIEFEQGGLPVSPLRNVMPPCVRIVLKQGGSRVLPRLSPDGPEAESKYELSLTGGQVDLPGERDIAVFRPRVFPFHLEMLREVLPAVGSADKSHRCFLPRRGRCERQSYSIVLGKEHGIALVIADPSGIPVAAVGQVRREQCIEPIVRK